MGIPIHDINGLTQERWTGVMSFLHYPSEVIVFVFFVVFFFSDGPRHIITSKDNLQRNFRNQSHVYPTFHLNFLTPAPHDVFSRLSEIVQSCPISAAISLGHTSDHGLYTPRHSHFYRRHLDAYKAMKSKIDYISYNLALAIPSFQTPMFDPCYAEFISRKL